MALFDINSLNSALLGGGGLPMTGPVGGGTPSPALNIVNSGMNNVPTPAPTNPLGNLGGALGGGEAPTSPGAMPQASPAPSGLANQGSASVTPTVSSSPNLGQSNLSTPTVQSPVGGVENTNLPIAAEISDSIISEAPKLAEGQTTWGEGWTGWDDFLNRMSGNNMSAENTQKYQNNTGMASMLSALGQSLLPKNSPLGNFAGALNSMQQGALMGSNAKQGEQSLGGMQEGSAQATMSPAAKASGQSPSGQPQSPVSKPSMSAASGSPAKRSGQQTAFGYGRTLDPSAMQSVASALRDVRFTV